MPNPSSSLNPQRPAWWRRPPDPSTQAVKITNRPNGIAGALGFKRVVVTFNGMKSEPILDVPADDPLTTLQAGEQIEAYFKSLDEVKKLIIVSIDCRMDDMLGGYDVTINTEEWIDQGFVPGDPLAPINNLDEDIETIIFDCDCAGFKQGNGVSFDSQDSQELGWKDCPCCHKPFKIRTSKSASYATPPIATSATSASYLSSNDLLTVPTQSSKIKFSDILSEAIKTPEFREYIVQIVKEQKDKPNP